MVNGDKTYPSPVYVIATATLLFVYLGSLQAVTRGMLFACLILSAFAVSLASAIRSIPAENSHSRSPGSSIPLLVFLGLYAGMAGCIRIRAEDSPLKTLAPEDRVVIAYGVLLEDPHKAGDEWYRARLQVNAVQDSGNRLCSSDGICTLLLPAGLVRQSLPGGISGRATDVVVFAKGLSLVLEGSILGARDEPGTSFLVTGATQQGLPAIPGRGQTSVITSNIGKFRAGLRVALTRLLYDWGDPGGLLLALVSGNRDYVEPGLEKAFKTAGLAHVLALSGMHLSLLALVVIRTGKRVAGSRISLRISMVAMVFFVWFAGNSPSLDRSLFMALSGILFKRLGFGTKVLPVLALSCFVQTALDPRAALSLAFMLSYSALLGILLIGEALNRLAECRLPRVFVTAIDASIGAQLATAPVSALFLGVLSPAGIPASCVVSPLSSIFLVGGMLLLVLSLLIPGTEHLCGLLLGFMYRAVSAPVMFFSRFPPVILKDLSACALAAILSVATGTVVLAADCRSRSRRSPHAGFARL